MLQEIEQVIGTLVPQAPWSQLPSEHFSKPDCRGRTADAIDTELALPELVFLVVAAFRRHPHINNVLTHISGGNWLRIEQALSAILDPNAGHGALSPLAINIVDLMCADRGITGRILKPYYKNLLTSALGEQAAHRLIVHVTCLFAEHEEVALQAAQALKHERTGERHETASTP